MDTGPKFETRMGFVCFLWAFMGLLIALPAGFMITLPEEPGRQGGMGLPVPVGVAGGAVAWAATFCFGMFRRPIPAWVCVGEDGLVIQRRERRLEYPWADFTRVETGKMGWKSVKWKFHLPNGKAILLSDEWFAPEGWKRMEEALDRRLAQRGILIEVRNR